LSVTHLFLHPGEDFLQILSIVSIISLATDLSPYPRMIYHAAELSIKAPWSHSTIPQCFTLSFIQVLVFLVFLNGVGRASI